MVQKSKKTNRKNKTKNSNKTVKLNTNRPSPAESATLFPEGTIKRGNNKKRWVIKVNKGVHRWVPLINAEINGMQLLTVDYLAKNIGKPVKYLEGEYQEMVPKSMKPVPEEYIRTDTFTPNGDISIAGKVIKDWLKHRKPDLPDHKIISVLSDVDDSMQVDSMNKKTCSTNVMNSQAWIKL
jgi:hypothetical protein